MAIAIKKISGQARSSVKRTNSKYMHHNELLKLPFINDPNLQAYWRFESSSVDETANDNDGTDTNITYASWAGYFGNGAYFPSTGRIVFPTRIINTGPGSIGFWIAKSDPPPTASTIYSCGLGWDGDNAGIYSWISSDGKLIFLHRQGVSNIQNYCETGQVATGVGWHHYVHTWTGNTSAGGHKTYKDGVLVNQQTPTFSDPAPSGSRTFLGSAYYNSQAYPFADGIIDDLFLMNRVLTASEVSDLYGKQMKKFMGVSNV